MTPWLRQEPALRLRTLPDLDTAEPADLLQLAADVSHLDDALAVLCDSPLHVRAVVGLIEDRDLECERLAKRLSTLEQQLAIAQGIAMTLRRQLAERGTIAIEERRDGGTFTVTELAAVAP